MLALSLLGPFAAYLEERPLTQFSTQKVQALLIYLAVEARQIHQRESLMALLWPDSPQKSAQQSLRQTLYLLRQAVEPEKRNTRLILAKRFTVALNQDTLALDIEKFEELSANGSTPQEWQQAVNLYQGHFLTDFYLLDSQPFEEWATSKRAFYQRRMQELLQHLVDHYLEIGDDAAAETAVRRQLELDNLQEAAHRQLIEILARNGRRQEALTHYQTLHQLLQDELAIEPEQETHALIETIRADNFAKPESTTAFQTLLPANEPEPPKHNLPQQLTSFIGREKEIVAITDLLSQHRLVMLTGVGGIGKTNLSLQVGRKLLDTFLDGVWLVELAPLANGELIAQTAAHTLGVRESSEDTFSNPGSGIQRKSSRSILEILLDHLQNKKCLLILDNCEHLIDDASQFVQILLQDCAQVKILASSRETLGTPGEVPFRVAPLSVPNAQHLPDIRDWQQYEAIQLFVERATAVFPQFQVTPANFKPLIQICQQLDGIPLALELAAARAQILTIKQIAIRLEDRFRLLTTGSRTTLPRHQTLRALIDWSWDLLTDDERKLLPRLSVFAGGMTLEAVEAICSGDGLNVDDVLNLLSELINKSLVIARREQGQETRYQLLETIRQYAQERLLTAGQRNIFRQRHLDYFLQTCEQADFPVTTPEQVALILQLEKEMDNLRSALRWARETNCEAGLKLISVSWRVWIRGYAREGEAWLLALLPMAKEIPLTLKANINRILSEFNFRIYYDIDRTRELAETSLALYQELGDQWGIARSLRLLYFFDKQQSKEHLLQESLAIFRTLGDKLGQAEVLGTLGLEEAFHNNFDQAMVFLRESASIYRDLGYLHGLVWILSNIGMICIWQEDYLSAQSVMEERLTIQEALGLGETADDISDELGLLYFRLGDYEQAKLYFEKSLPILMQTGNLQNAYWAEAHLGHVLVRMSDYVQARKLLTKSLGQFINSNKEDGIVYTLEGMASLALIQEEPKRSVQLFAWADAMRKVIDDPRPPVEQKSVDKDIAIIREMLNEETFAAAYATGQAMTMDEAIALAMEIEIT